MAQLSAAGNVNDAVMEVVAALQHARADRPQKRNRRDRDSHDFPLHPSSSGCALNSVENSCSMLRAAAVAIRSAQGAGSERTRIVAVPETIVGPSLPIVNSLFSSIPSLPMISMDADGGANKSVSPQGGNEQRMRWSSMREIDAALRRHNSLVEAALSGFHQNSTSIAASSSTRRP